MGPDIPDNALHMDKTVLLHLMDKTVLLHHMDKTVLLHLAILVAIYCQLTANEFHTILRHC